MIDQSETGETGPMRFLDFALRAWREGPYVQVIAHSTPAGGMRALERRNGQPQVP